MFIHDSDLCQICGEVGEDRRTLVLRYFYALDEISNKFKKAPDGDYYSIRTCKDCRGDFLSMMRKWTNHECAQPKGAGAIPTRVDGRVLMLTQEEWDTRRKGDRK